LLDPAWRGHGVVVDKRDDVSPAGAHAAVARSGEASLLPVLDRQHVRRLRAHPIEQLRVVIDDDDHLMRSAGLVTE